MLRPLLDQVVRAYGAIPYRFGPRGAALLGRAGYGASVSERRLALWNLQHCYGQYSTAWRRWVALRFFEHIAISTYEVFRSVEHPEEMEARIQIEHKEVLQAALARGRGVVAVAGHVGNFGLLPFALHAASPEPSYLARVASGRVSPLIQAWRSYYRDSLKPRAGMNVLTSTLGGGLNAAHSLRRGNLVVIFSDLAWDSGSIPVRLLGVEHQVSRAPAALALRTGAVFLPVMTTRLPDGTHHISIEAPLCPPAPACSRREAEQTMMEQFTAILERQVQAKPEQWYWLHRSWRPARQG